MTFRLNLIVFLCGACVMVLELVGSRLFAPYLGTSLYVWTSLIGVILGCLSLGYWAGGVFADRRPDAKTLAGLILVSGVSVGAVGWAGDRVLFQIQNAIADIRIGSVVATFVLFGLPSVLLGMVSPYAVRLAVSRVERTGSTTGTLYALSTLGSIAGTFAAGFFLLSFFSHRAVLFLVSMVLIALAPVAAGGRASHAKAAIAGLLVLGASTLEPFVHSVMGKAFLESQTTYNRVWIYDAYLGGRPTRVLQVNDSNDSAMFLNTDELVLEYTKYFRLAGYFHPSPRRALMIGGGGYSYAKDFLREFPEASMDVVEIDPKLTALARQYFRLPDDPRLRIFHEDARMFLKGTQERYDVIISDVYRSYTIPFQLTTREAMREFHESLEPDGVFLLNVISTAEGEDSRFLRALLATMDPYFPQILPFAIETTEDGGQLQNLVLVAFKSSADRSFVSQDPERARMLGRLWTREIMRDVPPLTDALAPVEHYTSGILRLADRRNGILQKKIRSDAGRSRAS